MNQYILVDTWNGEGYSDSNATIIEAENYGKACEVAVERAKEACGDNGSVRVFNGNNAQYTIDDDNGAYTVLPYDGQYGICIFPDVNSFTTLPSRASYLRALSESAKQAELPSDSPEIVEVLEDECGCLHTSAGCEIFQKLNPWEELEFYDGGDGVEYEIWNNKLTGQKYKVPISIERDFVNMERI